MDHQIPEGGALAEITTLAQRFRCQLSLSKAKNFAGHSICPTGSSQSAISMQDGQPALRKASGRGLNKKRVSAPKKHSKKVSEHRQSVKTNDPLKESPPPKPPVQAKEKNRQRCAIPNKTLVRQMRQDRYQERKLHAQLSFNKATNLSQQERIKELEEKIHSLEHSMEEYEQLKRKTDLLCSLSTQLLMALPEDQRLSSLQSFCQSRGVEDASLLSYLDIKPS